MGVRIMRYDQGSDSIALVCHSKVAPIDVDFDVKIHLRHQRDVL